MAHPHHEHRAHKVEHRRVAHITKGYAHGGAVHEDAAEDRKMIRAELKKHDREKKHRADGGAVRARLDRAPRRAKGGSVKHKGKTTVNVVVGHPGAGGPPPMPMAPPIAALPPRPVAPPMPPPGLPPGIGPGMAPPGAGPPGLPMGPRKAGGRTYKRGGAVKDGPAWNEGKRNGTQVQHADGKQDGANIGRGKPITFRKGGRVHRDEGGAIQSSSKEREVEPNSVAGGSMQNKRATGGPVEHPVHGGMAPDLHAGAGGGLGRLRKAKRAKL